jgi:hypothetical protein
MRDQIRALEQAQPLLEGNKELSRDLQNLLREFQSMQAQGGPAASALLDERIRSQLLGDVEQIELQLRRMLEEKQGGNVRSGASQPVPAGYSEAVAEYFRRLSKDK